MDTVRPLARTRWVRLGLTAAGLALGWTALSLATGWGAAPSHAADDDDQSLLGSLVSTVDTVTDLLPDSAEEPLDRAVEKVEVMTTKTVRTVSSTVDAVVEAKPVRKVTEVVTDVVEKVPVIGRVAEETRVTDVVGTVGDSASEVVGSVGGAVGAVVDAVVPAGTTPSVDGPDPSPGSPDPMTPPDPTETVVDDADAGASSAAPPAAEDLASASLRQAVDAALAVSTAAVGRAVGAERVATHVRAQTPRPPADLPGLPDVSPAVPTATSGASGSTHAPTVLPHADGPASPASTWTHRPPGDALPTSPVFPPDASPD